MGKSIFTPHMISWLAKGEDALDGFVWKTIMYFHPVISQIGWIMALLSARPRFLGLIPLLSASGHQIVSPGMENIISIFLPPPRIRPMEGDFVSVLRLQINQKAHL